MKNLFLSLLVSVCLATLLSLLISLALPRLNADQSQSLFANVHTIDRSQNALSHLQPGQDDNALDKLALGRSLINIPWVEAPAATTARDGLGPLFNANTCVSCHTNLGGGVGFYQSGPVDRSIVFMLASDQGVSSKGDSVYGTQLAVNAIQGVPIEVRASVNLKHRQVKYGDGHMVNLNHLKFQMNDLSYGPLMKQTTVNPRRTPALIGLGMVEQIPESQILANEDIDDADGDGVSGKANQVYSYQLKKKGLGRFGWKASSVSVIEQTAKALINDMGLTSNWFPQESCTNLQSECREAYQSKQLDVPFNRLEAMSDYLMNLRIPQSSQAKVNAVFKKTGCITCHQTGYSIGNGQVVNPYSDFLLHDMGDALADKSSAGQAGHREWRTQPLWGIGLAKTLNQRAGYLHDGRATTIEQAILWHDGEAASSRNAFMKLPQQNRNELIQFLENL